MSTELTPSALERDLREIPHVIGVVLLEGSDEHSPEIQVFTDGGGDHGVVRAAVHDILERHGRGSDAVYVHELGENTSSAANQDSAGPPPPPEQSETPRQSPAPRPTISRIHVDTSGPSPEAHVSLVLGGREAEGVGRGRPQEHTLRVIAATTLEAAQAFIGKGGIFALEGVSLAEVFGQEVLLVLVHIATGGGRYSIGAALVGDGRIRDAAVKATLDAVNRHFSIANTGT